MANGRMIAAAAGGAALLGLTAGLFAWSELRGDADLFAACRSGSVAGGMGAVGGPFELVSETGATLSDADAIDRPTLLYFGYTFCPDICPLDNARNAAATDLLAEHGIEARPVFITVDPARDTPQVMSDYTDALHPDMLGLTGSDQQVEAAVQAYRVYSRVPDTTDEHYLVDHTTFTYLVLPEHGVVDFFRRETPPEDIAERTACFVDHA